MLLEIMPYFPYSANRVELIHFARPSIIYLPSMPHPNTINPFTRPNLENARDRTSRNQLRFTAMPSFSDCDGIIQVRIVTFRVMHVSHIRCISCGLWWEDIFKVPFIHVRMFFPRILWVSDQGCSGLVAKRVHPRFEEEESPSRLSVKILVNERRVLFISDRLTAQWLIGRDPWFYQGPHTSSFTLPIF